MQMQMQMQMQASVTFLIKTSTMPFEASPSCATQKSHHRPTDVIDFNRMAFRIQKRPQTNLLWRHEIRLGHVHVIPQSWACLLAS
jgi:hypothetical protein